MSDRFPHLTGSTPFPDVDGVNVFQHANDYDYSKFNSTQMRITLTNVPYDLGEVHVGQRTVSGIGNVVYFETKAKRDAWLAKQPGKSWSTKIRRLHQEDEIDMPIPFDVASKYNYCYIDYPLVPNSSDPLDYQDAPRVSRWLYFVREIKRKANNDSVLIVKRDSWQTFIYDLNIQALMLTRGHAPVKAMPADTFLANPVENNRYLIGDEYIIGEAERVASSGSLALNDGEIYACIATYGAITADWTHNVPVSSSYLTDGDPAPRVLAFPVSNFQAFMQNVDADYPQFKQTIQAVFFIDKRFLALSQETYSFGGVNVHVANGAKQTFTLMDFDKSQFGYPARYQNLAKLYTMPFAYLELTDDRGNTRRVAIESCGGKLSVQVLSSVAFPYIALDTHINGIGGTTAHTFTFKNATSHSVTLTGRWYDYLVAHDIPVFEVVQDPGIHGAYSTYFDREQATSELNAAYANATGNALAAKTNATNSANSENTNAKATAKAEQLNANASATAAQLNANASATTAQQNANASAATAKANADASADTTVSNTALQTAGNTTITSQNNASQATDTDLSNALNQANQAWNAGYTFSTVNAEIDAKVQSAAVGAAGNIANAICSPNPVAGLISGIASAATSGVQTAIATNLARTQADAAVANSQNLVNAGNQNNTDKYNNQSANNTAVTNAGNSVATGQTANSAANAKANASRDQSNANANAKRSYGTDVANAKRSYDTGVANAERSYNTAEATADRAKTTAITNAGVTYDQALEVAGRSRTVAQSRIANILKQKGLEPPVTFGSAALDYSTTRPILYQANIITRSRGTIAAAGDMFLKYGYNCSCYWEFKTFNIMDKFTYWQADDIVVKDLAIPDLYVDEIRYFLLGGVTVWRNPEDIGHTTIYENGI